MIYLFCFNGLSTSVGYLMPKASLSKNSSGEDKGVHIFPKSSDPKVTAIARLEFELVYYDVAVYHVNHYATETPSIMRGNFNVIWN